jgi:DNA-binding response OmpR family regulator
MTRILVADDSETILLLLRTRLEMEGYDVTTAADGEEALEALAAPGASPDLILLDAMMPRKSGLDVLRELRSSGVETPVLIVSAHQEHEGIDGMTSGYLRKPIDFDSLLERVAELTS